MTKTTTTTGNKSSGHSKRAAAGRGNVVRRRSFSTPKRKPYRITKHQTGSVTYQFKLGRKKIDDMNVNAVTKAAIRRMVEKRYNRVRKRSRTRDKKQLKAMRLGMGVGLHDKKIKDSFTRRSTGRKHILERTLHISTRQYARRPESEKPMIDELMDNIVRFLDELDRGVGSGAEAFSGMERGDYVVAITLYVQYLQPKGTWRVSI